MNFIEMYDAECAERGLRWVKTVSDFIPNDAIQGGVDMNGQPLFIARGAYEGSLYPGKAGPHLPSGCVIATDNLAVDIAEYEVLCGSMDTFCWTTMVGDMADQEGKNFVKAGYDLNKSPLFVARAGFEGTRQIGYCTPDTSVGMTFGFSKTQMGAGDYEVLTFC